MKPAQVTEAHMLLACALDHALFHNVDSMDYSKAAQLIADSEARAIAAALDKLERELAIGRDAVRLYGVEVDNLAMLLDGADEDRKSAEETVKLLEARCDQLIKQSALVDSAFLEQKSRAETLLSAFTQFADHFRCFEHTSSDPSDSVAFSKARAIIAEHAE